MRKHYMKMLCLLLFFAISVQGVFAQTGSVSGRVVDETNQPLPGASVAVKGQNKITGTDANGNFKLAGVPGGAQTIVVTYIGYQTLEKAVQVSGDVTVNFQLQSSSKALTEVVVVGYGTARKKDLTGSVTSITAKDFNQGASVTPEQLISGKVAGVQITSNGGAPGSGSRIRVRGGSSLRASNDPLIVIDGVPVDNAGVSGVSNPLSFVNPNDIETFNVLKDASAAAIYGSRAANGVIIITTKKGDQNSKLKVNFSSLNSLSQATKQADVLSADEFRTLVNQHGNATQKALLGNANTNWQDQILNTAYMSDDNISVSGGIKALPYRISVGYLGQDGVLETSNLTRSSGAINLSPRLLKDHLKIDLNVKGAITKSRFADPGAIGAAVAFDPTQSVYSSNADVGGYFEWMGSDGKPNTLATNNPLSMLKQRVDKGRVRRSLGNVQFDYKFHFLPDLRANLNLGYDASVSDGDVTRYSTLASAYYIKGSTREYAQTKHNKLGEFYLNYTKDVKSISSRFDVTAGYSYQDWIRNEPGYLTHQGDGQAIVTNPIKTQNTLISYFGRLNYGFKERYLLTATIRRDGSSRFNEDNRWGLFPSVALAWRINDEPFLKNSKVISDLKLRAGYGVTGQQDVLGDYPYLARYVISDETAQYQFGNSYYSTFRPAGYDANIKWEETKTYNIGLDYGFLNGRITGSMEYYVKKTKDLLSVIPVPSGSNLTNEILTNVGYIENKGFEFVVNANPIKARDFNWDLGFNITFNRSEITNLTKVKNDQYKGILVGYIAGGTGNTLQIHSVGYAPYSFYVFKQVYAQDGSPLEGVYEDLNKDGVINEDDKYHYKSSDPKTYLGFNSDFSYKKWSLGFVLRANLGNYMYNNFSSNNGSYRNFNNPNAFLSNVSSSVLSTKFSSNQYFSDYYVENASFLRMDNLTLGYNFGKLMNNKVGLRLSASVQNAFVITKYSGLDPETQFTHGTGPLDTNIGGGIDRNFYPRPRTYSLGVNLDF